MAYLLLLALQLQIYGRSWSSLELRRGRASGDSGGWHAEELPELAVLALQPPCTESNQAQDQGMLGLCTGTGSTTSVLRAYAKPISTTLPETQAWPQAPKEELT